MADVGVAWDAPTAPHKPCWMMFLPQIQRLRRTVLIKPWAIPTGRVVGPLREPRPWGWALLLACRGSSLVSEFDLVCSKRWVVYLQSSLFLLAILGGCGLWQLSSERYSELQGRGLRWAASQLCHACKTASRPFSALLGPITHHACRCCRHWCRCCAAQAAAACCTAASSCAASPASWQPPLPPFGCT